MIHTDGTPTIASQYGGRRPERRTNQIDRRTIGADEVVFSLTKDDVRKLSHLLSHVEVELNLTAQERTIVAYVSLLNAQANAR